MRKSLLIAVALSMAWGMALQPAVALQAGTANGAAHQAFKDPALLELSKQYSQKATAQSPLLQELLDTLGLNYLHQLDPAKVYTINKDTKRVSVAQAPVTGQVGTASSFFGAGSVSTSIRATSADIEGIAVTSIFCPLGPQTADVKGFMASTVSRDPIGGIRNGTIVSDDFLQTTAQVNFRVLKVPGGARNPMNRTTMETTHTGSCGAEVKVQNVVSTWPPLRIGMAVDDTGSMGNELAGVQAALTNFINSHNTDLDKKQRGVSYELISFKDSPTLRLANTEDTDAAISAVNSLFASGGADCPEDSVGAVQLALDRIAGDENSAGEIVLVTDASPHSGDIDALIAQAKSLGVPVHVMLSGDCVATAASAPGIAATPSAKEVFERLARETGGLYFFRPGGTAADYAEILEQIFEQAVTGGDTEPPVVSVSATPTVVWPANHKMVRIDTTVSAVDAVDPNPVITLAGVTSNQETNGQGDGNTENDIEVTEDGHIYVRAERSGKGGGRTYTITYQAQDERGNIGFGSVDVVVPHNR